MQIFQQILDDINKLSTPQDQINYINNYRDNKIKEIKELTGRDLIIYVSDFKKNLPPQFGTNSITWDDKTIFSDLVENMDSKNVDIFLHSPGGSAEATEIIVSMLRENFDHIRYIIPNMAKSAATMMALSGDQILMDEKSELGPIDPQIQINGNFVPAQTVIDGFEEAQRVIKKDGPESLPAYLPLLNKYDLHFLQICENAKKLSQTLVEKWLSDHMLKDDKNGKKIAKKIAKTLADHREYLSHARPIKIADAKVLGLNIIDMRSQKELREKVWQLYCIIELYLDRTNVIKLYQNSKGVFLIKQIPNIIPQ